MQPLGENSVTYKDTEFHIGKALAHEQKRLLLRHAIPLLQGALEAEAENEQWKIFVSAFVNLPPDHYEALSAGMLAHVRYKSPNTNGQWMAINTPADVEAAFEGNGLSSFHMFDLDVRAFIVNFRESLDDMVSMYPALGTVMSLINTQMSIPSSQASSPPDSAPT